ncbi:MAG: spore coat protein CotJB [Clostridia bacterium]|nr:spore coat protein CotJB [Clostridia bacterium]
MNKREKLLKSVSQVQFALWELHLYLNTHPADMEAAALHSQYEQKLKKLCDEYEDKYGPLTPAAGEGAEWLKNPWPWDIEGE